ncbi:MAG: glycoside hydrolase family 9 protein [Opitutaceae bacterium]|nr:glycoside hydrolase family 9 protein [Opitutaceae bacterium]
MRRLILTSLLLLVAPVARAEFPPVSTIRLNTVGFLPDAAKVATIAAPGPGVFTVTDASTGATVLEQPLVGPREDADTRELLWIADFSVLTRPGRYNLKAAGTTFTADFTIAPDAFAAPFRTVARGLYLWRCGTAVRGEHNGDIFAQRACHLDDAWMDHVTGEHVRRDGTGGWHDAGDHNKYIVNAAITVGAMLRAWDDYGPAVRAIRLDIPETGGPIPDLLAEVKWEMDWFFKMQLEDGRVLHKLSTLHFGGMIMPDVEDTPRYFTSWSTAATAGFVANMAQFARIVRPFDAAYADRCLAAARKSYAVLVAHPEDTPSDMSKFRTGTYGTKDPDDRLWAAAELWETTGDAAVLADLEARIRALGTRFDEDFGWGSVKNMGFLTYLRSTRDGRDPVLVDVLRKELIAMADLIIGRSQHGGYGRPLGSIYYWGCHGGVAMQTMLLQNAHRLTGRAIYRTVALQSVDHLLGRNYFGRSMVTGVGRFPPMRPHDRRSAGDQVDAPWPGYLVGGPEKGARDWDDLTPRYQVNETAINWNGAMIYALAGFLPTP